MVGDPHGIPHPIVWIGKLIARLDSALLGEIPAEKSGNSEAALARLVDLLSENVKTTSDRLLNSLESLLSAVLMVTVAIALLCVMLPLIGIMNSIG